MRKGKEVKKEEITKQVNKGRKQGNNREKEVKHQ